MQFFSFVLLLACVTTEALSTVVVDKRVMQMCAYVSDADDQALIHLVNQSVSQLYSTSYKAYQMPSSTIAIVTRATASIFDYAAYSYFLQYLYAQNNNYILLPLTDDSTRDDYQYHRKLVPILEALSDQRTLVPDYVAWIDSDLIMLDFSLRIEQIAVAHPSAHILMSADASSVANTGFIVVRNTDWAAQFLRDWLAQKDEPGAINEQIGFEAAYSQRMAAGGATAGEVTRKITILEAHVLNSVPPPMGEQLPHHKVLHLAAESSEMRRAVFRHAAVNVCRHLVDGAQLPAQLGVTRRFLQETAVDVYRRSYQSLEATLLDGEGSGDMTGPRPAVSVDAVAAYRSGVSKYCHAVAYSSSSSSGGGGGVETDGTLAVRRRAFLLVRDLALRSVARVLGTTGASNAVVFDSKHGRYVRYVPAVNSGGGIVGAVEVQQRLAAVDIRALLAAQSDVPVSDCSADETDAQSVPTITDPRELSSLWQDVPELLKLSAELAYELLLCSSRRPNDAVAKALPPVSEGTSRLEVVSFVQHAIELLLVIVHPSQSTVVLDMQRSFSDYLAQSPA